MTEDGDPPDHAPAKPQLGPSGVDPRLLEILICPQTRHPLSYDRAANELVSKRARLAYPIRGGIPVMLPEEARDLDTGADGEGAP